MGGVNQQRNSSSLGGGLDLHVFGGIGQLASVQHDAAKGDFRRQVRGREWLRIGDDEVERRFALWFQRWPVFRAADDPFGGLANHFALVVEQKTSGAGGFDFTGKIVFHHQLHHGFLADHFGRRDRDGKLCLRCDGANQREINQNSINVGHGFTVDLYWRLLESRSFSILRPSGAALKANGFYREAKQTVAFRRILIDCS